MCVLSQSLVSQLSASTRQSGASGSAAGAGRRRSVKDLLDIKAEMRRKALVQVSQGLPSRIHTPAGPSVCMCDCVQGFVQCLGKYEGDPFETMFLKIEKQEPQTQPQVGRG